MRAETQSNERLEAYAKEVERRVNERLAAVGPIYGNDLRRTYIDQVAREMIPDEWDWIDATAINGPPKIAISQYCRL